MMPFDQYPGGGKALLGACPDDNCRHGYGLKLQRLTGQTSCAYCGLSLVDTYEHWLLMSVDHLVPTGSGLALGIEKSWLKDFCNTVLCCRGCNEFKNHFLLPAGSIVPAELGGFFELRDATFAMRKKLILASVEMERAFYWSRPWEQPLAPRGLQ